MSYKNLNIQREYSKLWRRKRHIIEREYAFKVLGNKCKVCGINDLRVLQIDHIKAIRRKNNSDPYESGSRLRQRIYNKSRNLKNLQLLCANCHQIKTKKEFGLVKGVDFT